VVERQLPKLYVVGSIPIARSRFLKQLKAVGITLAGQQSEQKGKSREQTGRFTTKNPEKVPSYVQPMFLAPHDVVSADTRLLLSKVQ
jgi:hypothetical protein